MQHPFDRCSGEEVACDIAILPRYRKAIQPKTRCNVYGLSFKQLQASQLCERDDEINAM